jgi:hypothetical protein
LIGQRVNTGHVEPHWVEQCAGNYIAEKRIPQELWVRWANRPPRVKVWVQSCGEWIENLDEIAASVEVLAEISDTRLSRRHRIDKGQPADFPQTGIIAEDERAVMSVIEFGQIKRSAERRAKLVAAKRGFRLRRQGKEVFGVQLIVAQVLERGAMNRIAARFG